MSDQEPVVFSKAKKRKEVEAAEAFIAEQLKKLSRTQENHGEDR